MNSASSPSPAPWARLYGVYLIVTLLLVLPSATLWFGTPFRVFDHNFDYFCGLLQIPGWAPHQIKFLGRFVEAILFLAGGCCFYRLATRHAEAIEQTPRRTFVILVAALLAIHLIALPWLNPDVFWAIGRGWMDTRYSLDAYLVPTSVMRNAATDPMFRNIDPELLKNVGNYGPLHHTIAALLTGLSFGNIKAAVLLFKLLDLAFLLGSAVIVFKLARTLGLKAQHVTFCYLANPIVPLVFVAWAHNDVMQNFFLLLAVFCVFREKPFLSGLSLGAAISIKYVAIVLAPALLIYWLRAKKWNIRATLLALAGLLGIVIYTHAMYEGAWQTTVRIYTVPWSPIRSSLSVLMVPISTVFSWSDLTSGIVRLSFSGLYILSGAILTFATLWKRDVKPADFAKVCVWIFNFYFLFAAPAVLEWYLTWSLGCLLLFPAYFRSFSVLYSFWLPLVPFTVYLPDWVQYPVNIAHYLLFVVCAAVLMPWRFRGSDEVVTETPAPTCA